MGEYYNATISGRQKEMIRSTLLVQNNFEVVFENVQCVLYLIIKMRSDKRGHSKLLKRPQFFILLFIYDTLKLLISSY